MVEWKKLGQACKFFRGRSLSKTDIGLGKANVILYGELYTTYGNYITSVKSQTSTEIAETATSIQRNDLLLPVSSTTKEAQIGKASVYLGDDDVSLGSDAIILRGAPNSAYLMYYLNSSLFEKDKMSCVHGTTIMHLSPKELVDKTIPIPSIPEQQRIVAILDTFTSSIENLKEQIAQRRKQYEYYRDQLLDLEGKEGVDIKTLGEIAKYRRGSFPQPYGNREWYDGEGAMPFVQVADVEEFGRKLKERTKQFISTLAMPKSVYAPIGTVIVTLQGSIGKVAITQYESYIDRTLGIFEGYRIKIDKIYFALQLEKIFSIKKEKARGGTIKTITKEEFTDFLIPVPSLEEQSRIVSILDTFEASIQNLEAQLKEREKQYEYYRNKLLTFE